MSVPSCRILVFAGSARRESFNKKLAKVAASRIDHFGGEATFADLADFPMPLYNQDLEDGQFPDAAIRFKQLMIDHDGFLIASPEYNSSITPLLKNTIDWCSRSATKGEASAYRGKIAALVATSPGALGGLRGLGPVRSILHSMGVHVIPQQLAVPKAFAAFDDQGALVDDGIVGKLDGVVQTLLDTARRLKD